MVACLSLSSSSLLPVYWRLNIKSGTYSCGKQGRVHSDTTCVQRRFREGKHPKSWLTFMPKAKGQNSLVSVGTLKGGNTDCMDCTEHTMEEYVYTNHGFLLH